MAYNVKNWNDIENYLFETYGIESAYDDKLHDLMDRHDKQVYHKALLTNNNMEKEIPIENSVPVIQCNDIKATLLSTGEHAQYEDIIPYIDENWWLRSPGLPWNAANEVRYIRGTDCLRCSHTAHLGVRPAFVLSTPDASLYKAGDKVQIANFECPCTVLESNNGSLYVLADQLIGYRIFDKETNVWEKSCLKEWLDSYKEYVFDRKDQTEELEGDYDLE